MTAHVASVAYLLRRNDRYSFRRAFPQHLTRRIGRREVKLSLKTVDLSVARRRARILANKFELLLEAVERKMTEPNRHEIDDLIKRYMAQEWARAERDALADNGEFDEVGAAEMGVEVCDEKLARNQFDGFDVIRAQAALQDAMPEPDSPNYRRAINLTLRADREAARMRSAAFRGRYPQPLDPLFADLAPDHGDGAERITIKGALAMWFEERNPKARTRDEWDVAIRRFTELHGDLPVRSITRKHVVAFKDALVRLPRAPSGDLYGLPVPDLLKRAPKGGPRLSARTVAKQLAAIHSLLAWCLDNDHVDANAADRVRVKVPPKDETPRLPYEIGELNALFKGPVHTDGHRARGGEACYWFPLLALFTGCRLGELAQLTVGDARREDGIDYLDINDRGGKSLKSRTSRRQIPVHSELIRLGFPDYAAERRRHGPEARMFPDVDTRKWGKWYSRYARDFVPDRVKTFHSFRHFFKDRCRAASIGEEISDRLTGHANGSVGRGYGNGHDLKTLAEAVSRIAYPDLKLPPKWRGADL